MNIINQMKAYRQATGECIKSQNIPKQEKQILKSTQQFLQYSYYGTKVLIALSFIFLVDWKRPMPIMRRQVPCAFIGFGLCALTDYLSHKYALSKTQSILVKYTGFRDGIYVNPDKFMTMRNNFQNNGMGRIYEETQNDLMD